MIGLYSTIRNIKLLVYKHIYVFKRKMFQFMGRMGVLRLISCFLICLFVTMQPLRLLVLRIIKLTFFSIHRCCRGNIFACSMVILDTGINPTSENPLSYTSYQKTLWLLFNRNQQIMIQTYLGRYEISTDTNFLPFETVETREGYFVDQSVVTTIVNNKLQPLFIDSYIFASSLNRIINRQYGKIDQVLSYVGGLYGVVISFFAFFLMSYNQYKYELRVSQGTFSQRGRDPIRENDLHFGKYLKYVAFDWIKSLLCCQPNWNECKIIDQVREQANEQVDVKHLLKRISHLQNIISIMSTSQISNSIFMLKSPSIEFVKSRRDLMEYCELFEGSFIKNMSIEDFQQMQANQSSSVIFNRQNLDFQMNSSITSNSKILVNFQKTQENKNQQLRTPKNSLEIMVEFVEKYKIRYNLKDKNQFIQMSQNHLITEQQLSSSFFELKQEDRIKIVKKIPLGILLRLSQYLNKKGQTRAIENEYKEQNKTTFFSQNSNVLENKQKARKNGKIRPNFSKTTNQIYK